jgi:3-dehydroquinate synthase
VTPELPSLEPTFELHGSRIYIGAALLDEVGPLVRRALGTRRLVILSDDTVAPLYAAGVAERCGVDAQAILTMPAGEAHKTRESWSRLTDIMLDAGYGRDSAVLALGGGVVGDMAGFVAATYMRGIPVVQLPTTLLAMIDAAVGGKTGVDTRAGKNLVGAFHHPTLVIADPRTFRTLPVEQLRNGLAEAVKHGVVASAENFAFIGANAAQIVQAGGPDDLLGTELVRRNIEIKAGVVAADEKESGIRKILNFGHTIGHAVETLSGYTLLHGECVAIGMVVEARIAAALGLADASVAAQITHVLREVGLPVTVPSAIDGHAVLNATRTDKKARDGAVEYALPSHIGAMAGGDRDWATPVPDAVVLDALRETGRK